MSDSAEWTVVNWLAFIMFIVLILVALVIGIVGGCNAYRRARDERETKTLPHRSGRVAEP